MTEINVQNVTAQSVPVAEGTIEPAAELTVEHTDDIDRLIEAGTLVKRPKHRDEESDAETSKPKGRKGDDK